MEKLKYVLIFLLICISGYLPAQTDQREQDEIKSIRFIGMYEIPFRYSYENTTVGGLSGIDYDEAEDLYYIICDDRGMFGPVRYYTAKIRLKSMGIDTVEFTSVTTLLRKDGTNYQPVQLNATNNVDPEGLRRNKLTNQIFWISEGERIVNKESKLLVQPALNVAFMDGKHSSEIALPEMLLHHFKEKGPRRNSSLEGIAFDKEFENLFVSVEEPLFEDGPKADTETKNVLTRIVKFDLDSGKQIAQYAYPLDAVAVMPIPADGYKINGISEILYVSPDNLIVVERSFSMGTLPCTVKIFLANLKEATNVADNASLKQTPPANPVSKELLFNMDTLGIYIDNIEGLTFGPILENGKRSLIFVSDNNFNVFQKTQLLLFEIN